MPVTETQWIELFKKSGLAAGGAAVAVAITTVGDWSAWWTALVLPALALAQSWLAARTAAVRQARATRKAARRSSAAIR